jgi:hypothetical protein
MRKKSYFSPASEVFSLTLREVVSCSCLSVTPVTTLEVVDHGRRDGYQNPDTSMSEERPLSNSRGLIVVRACRDNITSAGLYAMTPSDDGIVILAGGKTVARMLRHRASLSEARIDPPFLRSCVVELSVLSQFYYQGVCYRLTIMTSCPQKLSHHQRVIKTARNAGPCRLRTQPWTHHYIITAMPYAGKHACEMR